MTESIGTENTRDIRRSKRNEFWAQVKAWVLGILAWGALIALLFAVIFIPAIVLGNLTDDAPPVRINCPGASQLVVTRTADSITYSCVAR